jgi:VWFA-related protein
MSGDPGRCARLALVALLVGGQLAAAQIPLPGRPDRPRLKTGVDMTVVTITVRDGNGQLVKGLPREAFEVYEDGDRQTITQFTNDRVPVGLGLLLDVSDSMFGQRIRDAREAVELFLTELLAPTDAFFVTSFNHAPHVLTSWTSDPADVKAVLAGVRPTGGTAIYDTVLSVLPLIDRCTRERAAMVIISDGADTASDATLRDVRTALLRTDAFVYAVAIDSPGRQAINTRVNPEALSEITNQSGGHTEVVHDSADLSAATARIAEELNNQYMLGYSSPHPGDGHYHSIRVRVAGDGYRVRFRNGYVSSPAPKTKFQN